MVVVMTTVTTVNEDTAWFTHECPGGKAIVLQSVFGLFALAFAPTICPSVYHIFDS